MTKNRENVQGAGCEDFNNEKYHQKDDEKVEQKNEAAARGSTKVTQQNKILVNLMMWK